jgi:hypothetical protein
MQAVQSKHLMPTKHQSKPLVTSGLHKNVINLVGNDFAFKAKNKGFVKDINHDLGVMIIQYEEPKSTVISDSFKKYDIINLNPQEFKNSGGGFYTTQQKQTDLKKGDKFKKNDIIAYNKNYFNKSSVYKNETFFMSGSLAKVAVMGDWANLEDGSTINEKLIKKLESNVTIHKEVEMGKNSNIIQIVDVGDTVRTSDPLITIEKSFEDESINKVLDSLGSDFTDTIEELSKNVIKSKNTGEIVDINILYNVPFETLSESIQKLIKKFKIRDSRKENYVKKAIEDADKSEKDSVYNINGLFNNYDQIHSDKIKGKRMKGVLIEFFIRTKDSLSIGDKIIFSVAVKSIISKIVNEDDYSYSESNPNEIIEATISPFSPLNRMTCDFYNQLCINKVLLGLKEKIKKIVKK